MEIVGFIVAFSLHVCLQYRDLSIKSKTRPRAKKQTNNKVL